MTLELQREQIRGEARAYERSLPAARRKQLGQYFSGVPLGKLLAHLALDDATRTVLDPMSGHGDLLDAAWEAAAERGLSIERLDGIEIDPPTADRARERLHRLTRGRKGPKGLIVEGDAFSVSTLEKLHESQYDLVIANPPYVRYQSRGSKGDTDPVRAGLRRIVARESGAAHEVWSKLARGYSGLADLSIPAWLLAAAMVKPLGRLALIVPATWRSRNYADVVRYLLLRCFSVEYIVEDQQPGWFSDALVRTHLIVARRLDDARIETPLSDRDVLPAAQWLEIAPQAASKASLVGAAFSGKTPELALVRWLRRDKRDVKAGLTVRPFEARAEWQDLRLQTRKKAWIRALESEGRADVASSVSVSRAEALPGPLRAMLPATASAVSFAALEELGLTAGQGLRTGCNAFFYVTATDRMVDGQVVVETSALFDHRKVPVPASVLKPVLRRQSELSAFAHGERLNGRVLDLRGWALPEDIENGNARRAADLFGQKALKIMPDALADFVRLAARTRHGDTPAAALVPELSAVRTNVRAGADGVRDRFWYTLPDFAPRHTPAAFVPRIIQEAPWVEANGETPVLVDANFSTLWAVSEGWSGAAIKALLNSAWCRASMEAIGTPMGGGALKLEAAHLRRMLVPPPAPDAPERLHRLGKGLNGAADPKLRPIDAIVLERLCAGKAEGIAKLAHDLDDLARSLSTARQRGAK